MPITWDEFKAEVEGQGVKGDTLIQWITYEGQHLPAVRLMKESPNIKGCAYIQNGISTPIRRRN